MLWKLVPFHNFRFSTEQRDYHHDTLPETSNDTWNISQKRDIHLIHLNIMSLLSKIDEICYIAKLTNATAIGLSKMKLDNSFQQ